jgi:hypothetical protein
MPPMPQNPKKSESTGDKISILSNLFKTQVKKKDAAEKETSGERHSSKFVSGFKKSLVGMTPDKSVDNLPPSIASPETDPGGLTRVVPMLNDINESKVIVGHLLMDLGQTRQ